MSSTRRRPSYLSFAFGLESEVARLGTLVTAIRHPSTRSGYYTGRDSTVGYRAGVNKRLVASCAAAGGVGFLCGVAVGGAPAIQRWASSANWADLPAAVIGGLFAAAAAAIFSLVGARRIARESLLGEVDARATISRSAQDLVYELGSFVEIVENADRPPNADTVVNIRSIVESLASSNHTKRLAGFPGLAAALQAIVAMDSWRRITDMMGTREAGPVQTLLAAVVDTARAAVEGLQVVVSQASATSLGEALDARLDTTVRWMWECQATVVMSEVDDHETGV